MEELKAKRFVKGLRPGIRRAVRPFNPITYHDAVQKALLVEQEEFEIKWLPSGPGETSQAGRLQKPMKSKDTTKVGKPSVDGKAKSKFVGPRCP